MFIIPGHNKKFVLFNKRLPTLYEAYGETLTHGIAFS